MSTELKFTAEQQRDAEQMLGRLEYMLRMGRFDLVDEVLTELDVSRECPAALIVILGITVHAKDRLTRRHEFLARAETALRERVGAERANHLLMDRR